MRTLLLILLGLCPTLAFADEVSFKNQLAPILTRRCLGCHNNRKAAGRYALHTFEQLLKAGDSEEPPIVPGNLEESYLYQKLIEPDETLRMPREDDPLKATEIALFKAWIEQGARFDGPAVADRLVTLLPARVHPEPPASYRRPVPVFALQFSADGALLYSAGVHEVLAWDAATGKLALRIPGLPQRMHALRLSPDGRTLAAAGGAPGEYGEIRLIRLADRTVRTLPVSEDVFLSLAFSRDGLKLVAGGADNSVRAYDISSGRELWRTQQHVDWVTALDVTDYEFAEEFVPNAATPAGFEFNLHEQASGSHPQQHWLFPDGRYIVRKANWELESHADEIVALTRITITGIGKTYEEKRVRITAPFESDHAAVIGQLQALHADWGRMAAASSFVLTASRDRTAKVFRLSDGGLLTTYKGHRREYGSLAGLHRVFGIAAEPGTRRVWSGGEGRHFHGWNPITVRDEDGTAADMESRFAKEYSIDVLRHDLPDAVFAMVRSGPRLFAATARGAVQSFAISGPAVKYDLNSRAPAAVFEGLSDQLYAIDVHAGPGRIAAGGFRGEIAVWSPDAAEPVLRFSASP